jgi:hypothetical protein
MLKLNGAWLCGLSSVPQGSGLSRLRSSTSIARKYHNMVLGGKVRAAVRMVTNRGTGGSYRPWDLDSKSGRPVIEVLHEKHPASRMPSEEDFDAHAGAPDCLDSMPVYCFKECVAKAAVPLRQRRPMRCRCGDAEELLDIAVDTLSTQGHSSPLSLLPIA